MPTHKWRALRIYYKTLIFQGEAGASTPQIINRLLKILKTQAADTFLNPIFKYLPVEVDPAFNIYANKVIEFTKISQKLNVYPDTIVDITFTQLCDFLLQKL